MKNILILLTVSAVMVSCGQNSVTDAPDATVKSTESVQAIAKEQTPGPAKTSPMASGSDKGVITTQGLSQCQDGLFCTWQDNNFTGMRVSYELDVDYVSDQWNDKATSVWNRTGRPVCAYVDAYYRGYSFKFQPDDSVANLTSWALNDKISSIRYC